MSRQRNDQLVNNMPTPIPSTNHPDVVLVGAGIMSATLAVILKELDPSLKIEIYEVLGSEAQESSNAWNNAGTGHAALCELNYTPQESDGSIDIASDIVTATRMVTGTDVDYGALTEELLASLSDKEGFSVHFYSRVQDLRRDGDRWNVQIRDEKTGQHRDVQAKFVFIGAGGGSLPLLQKSGIPEGYGYAGFPIYEITASRATPPSSSHLFATDEMRFGCKDLRPRAA